MQRGESTGEKILINVYDLHWTNEYTSALGLGVFHTGIEVYGIEFGYGGHPFPLTGVFEMVPRSSDELGEHFSFRETIILGTTSLSEDDVRDIVENLSPRYLGDQYHLLRYNCNHFSSELAQILCGSSIPGWINRLANMASSIPFVERALPKEWLTPCGLQTMASTNIGQIESARQRDGSMSSDVIESFAKASLSPTQPSAHSSSSNLSASNSSTNKSMSSSDNNKSQHHQQQHQQKSSSERIESSTKNRSEDSRWAVAN